MALQLVRIDDALPEAFPVLRDAAHAEGHRHLARLEHDLASGSQRFDREGEALLAAFLDGELVGIGGLTREPSRARRALRMRRLYVLPQARRHGVATAIANALTQEALAHARILTVHAGNPAAERFWEALGYAAVPDKPWTHELRLA